MSIVFCVNSLEGGGAEKIVLTLSNGFLNENKVHLIFVYKSNSYNISSNIKIHYLFETKPTGLLNKFLFMLKASLKLKRVIKEISQSENIKLYTSHLPLSNYISWLASIENHYAVIHSTFSKKYIGFIKRKIIYIIHKNKKLITVSQGVKNDLVNHFHLKRDEIITIYNPFDISYIQKQSIEIIEYSSPYILHIGRLTKLKRHDLLIKAYSKSKLSENYNLLLLGEGEEKENISSLIKDLKLEDKVILLGWKENPYKWIKKSDLLVLTSDYEGFGNVLVESLICNTPIVSINCNYGPNEILMKELLEFLVPTNNEKELIKAMDRAVLKYPRIIPEMYARFSLDNIIKQYSTLITKD